MQSRHSAAEALEAKSAAVRAFDDASRALARANEAAERANVAEDGTTKNREQIEEIEKSILAVEESTIENIKEVESVTSVALYTFATSLIYNYKPVAAVLTKACPDTTSHSSISVCHRKIEDVANVLSFLGQNDSLFELVSEDACSMLKTIADLAEDTGHSSVAVSEMVGYSSKCR